MTHEQTPSSSFGRPGSTRGTNLIHYGPLWDERLDALEATEPGRPPVAILVCHGMGQQVRYETISSVADSIRAAAIAKGGEAQPVTVRLCQTTGDFLARAEVRWKDSEREQHEVHIYEAYWAPLTQGKVTYWDTIKFLLSAAWNGLRYSRPFTKGTFTRWMFEEPRELSISPWAWFGIISILIFLAVQVGIIGYVSLSLAQQYKSVLSQPVPNLSVNGLLVTWLKWLSPLLPGIRTVLQPPDFASWVAAAAYLLLWIVLIAEAFAARYFLIEYVGDVAAYISPYKDSKFDELRQNIRQIGLDVGKVIYGFGSDQANVPRYQRFVVVGHSLGSVLAYDTLNALINLDNVCGPAAARNVVRRTRALITFGSPLDKTAFIFRTQAASDQAWIREQLAASMQPLIVDYDQYRPQTFTWVNIWSPMDIISGALDYYDNPTLPSDSPLRVQNTIDRDASFPLLAHVQYWRNASLRDALYKYVTER